MRFCVSISVYLGNQITVDRDRQKVGLDHTTFLDELLEKFGMRTSSAVQTPMVARLSGNGAGEKLDSTNHGLYRAMLGCLLYLSCWSRPDKAFAVSELSRFVSEPCHQHMVAVKHLLMYFKVGLTFSRPTGVRRRTYG